MFSHKIITDNAWEGNAITSVNDWDTDSLRDYVSEEDEPDDNYRVAKIINSPFQRIAVVETGLDTLIYGDGYVMFGTTDDDTVYGECLVHVPMSLAVKRERVLIVGGGGGITTREVLKYPDVTGVTVVEIDPHMMEFGRTLPALVRFNQNSLNNPKVTTVVMDGRRYIQKDSSTWDVIIIDIPEPTPVAPKLRRLFSREFYRLAGDRLEPGGVMGVACSTPSWMPEFFWSVKATIEAAGLQTLPYRYDAMVEYEEDWGYCAAAKHPLQPSDVNISVPTQFLPPEQLAELFAIPLGIRRYKNGAKVQTDRNRVMQKMTTDD